MGVVIAQISIDSINTDQNEINNSLQKPDSKESSVLEDTDTKEQLTADESSFVGSEEAKSVSKNKVVVSQEAIMNSIRWRSSAFYLIKWNNVLL